MNKICQCHFIDMLPEIRYLLDNGLIDENVMGKYDDYVDAMFEYQEDEDRFCRDFFHAADILRHWAICLNKQKDALDCIESPEERNKWLRTYPYTGTKRVDGRIYLTDYFDETSIEIDKILYLALMNRPGLIWERNIEADEKRMREYLYLTLQKCMERMEKEYINGRKEFGKIPYCIICTYVLYS